MYEDEIQIQCDATVTQVKGENASITKCVASPLVNATFLNLYIFLLMECKILRDE